jgi:hypothetical protein
MMLASMILTAFLSQNPTTPCDIVCDFQYRSMVYVYAQLPEGIVRLPVLDGIVPEIFTEEREDGRHKILDYRRHLRFNGRQPIQYMYKRDLERTPNPPSKEPSPEPQPQPEAEPKTPPPEPQKRVIIDYDRKPAPKPEFTPPPKQDPPPVKTTSPDGRTKPSEVKATEDAPKIKPTYR